MGKMFTKIYYINENMTIRHVTSTLVVTLHLRPLRSTDRAGIEPCLSRTDTPGRGANTEQALILCDITTKVLMTCRIVMVTIITLHTVLANSIIFTISCIQTLQVDQLN